MGHVVPDTVTMVSVVPVCTSDGSLDMCKFEALCYDGVSEGNEMVDPRLVSEHRKSQSRMMKFERKLCTEYYVCMVTCYCQASLVGEASYYEQQHDHLIESTSLVSIIVVARDTRF
ncbi:hypothetical protein PanWU01x14_097450 [Parasponia andersonii]|uniref:Uncharacterized protein n=1 Tax=Parasponia andersonii TaxID=3476 RepID=A0A2P5D4K9_PARAD|nr:hypothetical protein PanWU01x14_097450 [Parasponia andersonii]